MNYGEGNTNSKNNTVGVDVAELAKKLLHEVIIKAVIKHIVTAIPFFSLPIINPIIVFIVTKISEIIYERAELVGGLFIIDLREDSRLEKYNNAVDKLKDSIKKDPSSIEKAKSDYKKSISDLIRISN